jgi:7-carboxy-7-deazaguanine synthase
MHAARGYVHELFTSIQGEGLWAGMMQHFVRLAGCSATCSYCDTVRARDRSPPFVICGDSREENPVTVSRLVEMVAGLDRMRPGTQALSVTGGEPLEQPDFLGLFLEEVKAEILKGRPVLLETNGLHAEAMAQVADQVDLVSMDVKLPSTAGLDPIPDRHEKFLKVLAGTNYYIKMVVSGRTPAEEVAQACRMIAAIDPQAPLILQPETGASAPCTGPLLMALWAEARKSLEHVRVLPQMHKILDLE